MAYVTEKRQSYGAKEPTSRIQEGFFCAVMPRRGRANFTDSETLWLRLQGTINASGILAFGGGNGKREAGMSMVKDALAIYGGVKLLEKMTSQKTEPSGKPNSNDEEGCLGCGCLIVIVIVIGYFIG